MKLIADESVDFPIVQRLRRDGHDVCAILEDNPGMPDTEVIELAHEENRILLTVDRDFGALVFRTETSHVGVILLRLERLKLSKKAKAVSRAIDEHEAKFEQNFSVIMPGRVRFGG